MTEQADELERFLRLLEVEGCLQDVMLIGSWAEYLYWQSGLLAGFEPNIRTMDIDFLIRNLHRPQPAVNVSAAAREAGYLPEADYLDGVTKIYSDSGLEIEFLIGKRGAGREASLKTNIGVTAQALWHLDMLLQNPVHANWRGLDIVVPAPEAYAAHKMIINSERGQKSEKDAEAISSLWPFLSRESFDEVADRLSKKERAKVMAFLSNYDLL